MVLKKDFSPSDDSKDHNEDFFSGSLGQGEGKVRNLSLRHECNVLEIMQEAPDVRSLVLSVPASFDFISGQDVLVGFPDGRKISGKTSVPMTMSNPPTDGHKIILTIKDMGGFTSELMRLSVGDIVVVSDPRDGTFEVDGETKEDFIMIAAGTGITPFMSIIRFLLAKDKKNRVKLFYSNRNHEDIIFKDELDRIDKEQDTVDVIYTLTGSHPEDWSGNIGRITKDMILANITQEDIHERQWMVCGPKGMVSHIRGILSSIGVNDDRLLYEEWQLPGRSDIEGEVQTVSVEESSDETRVSQEDTAGTAILASADRDIELRAGPIRDAAEELGVPFGCKQGICGTCEVEVLEGQDNLEAKNNKEENMR